MRLRASILTTAAAMGSFALGASVANGALISSQADMTPGTTFVDDGVISGGEYSASYTGGGTGFGGTLGTGTIYMDADATNLYIGVALGNTLGDNVVIHLDTKSGGFTDADMNDTADPGRNLLSNLTRDVDDPLDILPDYGVVIGQFGEVSFELNAGSTPGHLTFMAYQGDQTGNSASLAREFAIPLSSIGSPTNVDFMVTYGSDTNYMSNESVPVQPYNAGANPGFDNNGTFTPVVHANHNQFVVPEPASLGLLGLGMFGLLGRRRAR